MNGVLEAQPQPGYCFEAAESTCMSDGVVLVVQERWYPQESGREETDVLKSGGSGDQSNSNPPDREMWNSCRHGDPIQCVVLLESAGGIVGVEPGGDM